MSDHQGSPASDRSSPDPSPSPRPIEATGDPHRDARPIVSVIDRSGRLWALALGAGLLAGVASWAVGEATLTAFKPELRRVEVMGAVSLQASRDDQIRADGQNAALAFGVLGAMLGLALGMAGGLARGSVRRGVGTGLAGLVAGAALGAGVSLALVPIFDRARLANPVSQDLLIPMLVHAGIWAAVGAAGGLAFGFGLGLDEKGRLARAAIGGLVGGALGAVAYEIIGATVFPLADTARPISMTPGTRLLARLLVAALAAAGTVLLIVGDRARTPATARPSS